jgi:hypothetical protein
MLTYHDSTAKPYRVKGASLPLLVGGILALAAEAVVMAALMAVVGLCAFGSIIRCLGRSVARRRSQKGPHLKPIGPP